MPDLSGQHWFKELPEISIEFSDDFLLNQILTRQPMIQNGLSLKSFGMK